MAPRVRFAKLESRSARLRLPQRKKPYSKTIERGVQQLYRRNKTAGAWSVRVCRGGEDWTDRLGTADDYQDADGKNVLTYWQAQDLARKRARGGKLTNDFSIKARVEHYRNDLQSRGRDVKNASRVLGHLVGTKLANKLVTASSLADDLSEFRDHLAAKGLKPATIDRINRAFKAALNLTADNDERITRRPWKLALKAFGGEEAAARNVILDDADRRAVRGAAYRNSNEFGELIDVLDETGARPSQVVRLTAEDVQADFSDRRTGRRQPRLMMPASRKGRGKKTARFTPVPITPELAERLKGRSGVLLQQADGTSWAKINLTRQFDRAMQGVTFNNPARVTMYSLRHTSIVRQLLANVPIRAVAAHHDTSVVMIERVYSKYIADHADEMVRATLPQPAEVISLGDRRNPGA
ncbi:MAG TPA: site-specific integrase [Xanthobacteraceae bacterium]